MLDIKDVTRILKATAYGDDVVKIVADFLSSDRSAEDADRLIAALSSMYSDMTSDESPVIYQILISQEDV